MKRKTILKRMFSIVLTGIMLASALTGCGGAQSNGGSSNASKLVEEQAKKYANVKDVKEITDGVTLTIAIPSNAKVLDYNTNNQTLLIEKALGVDLQFMELPSADYASKINVMIMGGDELPDIIFDPQGYTGWIEEDIIYDLSAFYKNETFAKNILEGSKRSGKDLVKYMTRPEGGIYILPKFHEEVYTSVNQKLWVYQPWLDKLGVSVPTTMEEFYNVCKKVTEQDMNGNGKKDEIGVSGSGLTAWFDCMMSSFVYAHDASWRVIKDGKISYAYTSNEWKEGLKYIKKFFDEGIIPKETLSQASDQYNAILNSSTPTLFSFAGYNFTGTDTQRRQEYTVVPALTGPTGTRYSCNIPTVPSAGAVITTDCENPLAAFLVCDYMCNKTMSITQRYGEEGVDWDYMENVTIADHSQFQPTVQGYDIQFYPYDMIAFWDSPSAQNKCYRQIGPMVLDMTLCSGAGIWKDSTDARAKLYATLELQTADAALACYADQPKEVIDYAPLTVEETDEYADVSAAIHSYVDEMTCAFLSGEKDIDSNWDAYIKELENIGVKDYVAVYQEAYDRVH